MIRIYKERDFKQAGFAKGHKAIRFSKDISERPEEFKDKSIVEMLTEHSSEAYILHQIKFDKETGLHYFDKFAVNYSNKFISLDCKPLIRGFVPEGDIHQSNHPTLHEIMPNKKEIHVIPSPARKLFYEEIKAYDGDFLCFELNLDEVLNEFASAGFTTRHFAPRFNCLSNPDNDKRYFREEGHERVKEGN